MQLKAVYLPERENAILQSELFKYYDKLDYITSINELTFWLQTDYRQTKELARTFLVVINKVLLDNVFRHVTQKTTHVLLNQLTNKTFVHDVYVNPFYISQVLEYSVRPISDEDRLEVENAIQRHLINCIRAFYYEPGSNLENALFSIFEIMSNHLSWLNVSYYKFELMEQRKPILLYTEKTDDLYVTYN